MKGPRDEFRDKVLRVLNRVGDLNMVDLDGTDSDTIVLAKWDTLLGRFSTEQLQTIAEYRKGSGRST